jgi:PmbA protein
VTHALEVAERALAAAAGDEVEALVHAEQSGFARFAASEVHQPTLIEDVGVQLRVVRDGRSGWAATNRISDEGLAEVARRAGEAAASAPPDPYFSGLAPPAAMPEIEGYDEETAALGPEDQAHLARRAIDAARDLDVYGYFTSGVTEQALATSTGLRTWQRLTDASTRVLAAGEGLSGYAEATWWAVAGLEPEAVTREAVETAWRTKGADGLEPGTYRAVLEPYALGELLLYFAFDSLNGLGLLEERSYLAGRLGQPLFDEKVSIADDSLDRRGLPKAFDFEGTPKERVQMIDNGVARGVVWDRTTAARAGEGHASTGHAPPVEQRVYGPFPFALSVAGGDAESPLELAELVGDGIHVTRLHYLGVVEPREGIVTGMTRDGTFRIRDGKVAEPLVNLRFTVSVPQLLADVPGLTRDPVLVNGSDFYGERYPFGVLCPALATARFTITGIGSGPGL